MRLTPWASRALLGQHVDHVLEILVVPALVGADRNSVGVFADRGPDDLGDRAVVPEVDDLATLGLNQAAHQIDGRIVPVEQAGGSHETQRCFGSRGGGGGEVLGRLAHDKALEYFGRPRYFNA